MRIVDAIVIGSGHNGLTAAAYLARAGWEVEVLERNAAAGGALATEELTLPGHLHDTWASWHPLFRGSRTYAELGPELAERGLEYVDGEIAAASALPGGEAIVAHHDPAATAAALPPPDRRAYLAEMTRYGGYGPFVGALLASELRSREGLGAAARLARHAGPSGTAELARGLLTSGRAWLDRHFTTAAVPALAAPWLLHAGLAPDDRGGGLQLPVMLSGKHRFGSPVVRGGSRRFVEAFTRLIHDHGGRVRTRAEVRRIVVANGRAVGVRTADEELQARRAVIANVTPTQLYLRLLADHAAPRRAIRQARRFRYGLACAMIHVALREPLRWRDARLDVAPLVHVTDGVDGVQRAYEQARAGLLPARPTIAVGQHTVLDPSRAPAGGGVLWLQLLGVPYAPRGDAAGRLDARGAWTEALEHAFHERVIGLIEPHVHNIDAVSAHRVLSPPALEAANPNLVRGDPYAGATDLRQSLLLRPLPAYGSHRTPVAGLWHIGASTFPGPGLNAASGRLVARRLLDAG